MFSWGAIQDIGAAVAGLVGIATLVGIFYRMGKIEGRWGEQLKHMAMTQDRFSEAFEDFTARNRSEHASMFQQSGSLSDRIARIEGRLDRNGWPRA